MKLLVPMFQTNISNAGGMIGGVEIKNARFKAPTWIVGLVNNLTYHGWDWKMVDGSAVTQKILVII